MHSLGGRDFVSRRLGGGSTPSSCSQRNRNQENDSITSLTPSLSMPPRMGSPAVPPCEAMIRGGGGGGNLSVAGHGSQQCNQGVLHQTSGQSADPA